MTHIRREVAPEDIDGRMACDYVEIPESASLDPMHGTSQCNGDPWVLKHRGGFVTINWNQRWWATGLDDLAFTKYGTKRLPAMPGEIGYSGRGWRQRLIDDALQALIALDEGPC